MVDALRETRRVLVTGSELVDMRPVASPRRTAQLEVVSPEGCWSAGSIDESPGVELDAACEQALATALANDWLVEERRQEFLSDTYWESEQELKIGPRRHHEPSSEVRRQARELLEEHPESSLRLRHLVSIARYRTR